MAISVGDAVLTITGDSTDLDRELSKVDGKVRGISSGMAKNTKVAGAVMTGVGAGITTAMGFAVKGAMDFETGMREVNTMMGLSEEEFQAFSKEVHALTTEMGVNAVEATGALYQAISAGVPKENVLEFLEIATKAAIGGVTDTETAVDGLTTVINAFKLPMSDAQKVADLMFTAVKGGKTTFEELSASMFNVAPIAAASGIEFDEVAAALATMTAQGTPTAQATTQLRQAMVALQKPTKEMNEVIQGMGYESGQTMLQELGFAETLNVLRDSTGGSNEILMKMFGSVEAGQAVLALTGINAEAFAGSLNEMENSSGAAQAAFEEMEKSASRQMEKLKESMKGIGDTIGAVLLPMLKDLLEKIKPIIDKIIDWIEKNPGLTKVIVIGTAALGLLMMVLGPLLMILPGLIAALPLLGVAFTLATGPVGIIIAAIAALIAIGVLLWKNWDKISEFFSDSWDKIKIIFRVAVAWIQVKLESWWDGILNFFNGIPEKIGQAFSTIKDIILLPFRAAIDGIERAINWLISQMNKISFTVPSWVPLIGGKHFGINLPQISLPSFKDFEGIIPGIPGTPMLATVHAGEYLGQGGGVTNNFNIASLIVREEADVDRIARELYTLQRTKARQHGT